jgi:ABC-type lipoprotein export system ATPase subunit
MAIIELESVSKVFGFGDATTIALDDVNLSVEKGEFIAIMGPSGSGKSTLMNVIGLLDRPSQGTYKLDTRNVSRLRSGARAKVRRDKIGFIFQSFNLLPRMTVIENVGLPLAYKGLTSVRRLHRASGIVEKIGLKTREYYYPHQLSGGQLQRVAIARALINKPSLLIADEPTGNLDTASTKVVMNLLKEIHKGGNTIIMVTHNAELTAYASRVVYMIDGHVHQDKPLRENETADVFKLHNAPSIDKTKRGQKNKKKAKK